MTEPRSSASVSKPNAAMGLHVLQLIRKSFLDKNYQADTCWKVTDIKMIDAPKLENSFQRRKLEMELERNPAELKEECLFTCYKSDEHISVIAGQGLYVQQSKFNFLGDSLLGVILCKHADIQLKAAQNEHQPKCWLMVFKVVCGRKLGVQPAGTVIRKPTDGADCHVSSVPPLLGETLGCQAIKSQVYLYEADRMSVTGYSLRPRQCVPQAYVEFISCSAPVISIPPAVHLPYPGTVPHQRVSSPSSHHASTSAPIYHTQRIPQNSAPVGCGIQPTIPTVSLSQKFPPYVPKSSLQIRNRMIPVVSQPPIAVPASSSAVKYSVLNWQQLATRLFTGEGSNNTNRVESNANMVNPGHHVRQQLATRVTRPRIVEICGNASRMEDNRLQVLLLNQTLVIELLQAFAKEMNTVAGVWKESGCNADTTVGLRNAILALQELRALFMQIAPVCQQFYRFVQDLFSGKTDRFPSLTVVQHQLKCLRTCQSTMSTIFKYFNEVVAKTSDRYTKSILLAHAVLSRKLLLLNCLNSLKDILLSFNCFHTSFSGVVAGEHVQQSTNTPDLPVTNSSGRLHSSHQQSLLRQPTTAPEANAFSPSLASLLAMSGQEMNHLSAASRQESVNSTRIQNNQACELQQRDEGSSCYDVRRVSAERAMPCERDEEGQSDVCLAENSGFQFGLRLPIVIAPDDGLIDEVVDMTTPIKQERTTARDKRCIIETIFIDADEIIPECIRTKSEDVRGESSVVAMSSEAFGLVLDILDEQNPGSSLAKVFCVSPDEMDKSELDNIQPCDLSSSRITKEQQSLAESATTVVQDCSLEETCLTSDDVDLTTSVKSDSFFESSQSEEVGSETENVEPEFVLNIEPTTEETSDSEPTLSRNLNFHSQPENSNSQIIADSDCVPGLSSDVCDTRLACTESDSVQLEKSCAIGTVEVASEVAISVLKQKKCLRKKQKTFVKRNKLFFIRKFRNWTRRLYGRKKPTALNRILTIKPRSVNRKCRTSRALLKKSNCRKTQESETTDVRDGSAKVSSAERLQISEQAEVVMPGPKEIDDTLAENSSVVDFPVTESQSQDLSSQDLSANTSISENTSTATAHTELSENCIDPSLASFKDSNVAKTGDNTSESSFLIASVSTSSSETGFGTEKQFKNMNSDIRAFERDNGSALVCEKIVAEDTQLPLTIVKSEPTMVTDFDLAADQKPRICENQQAVDDELIAEVVANAYAFDGGISDDDSDSEAGFLKIRIENVCSIGAEGFESMNYVTYIKTESGVNVEESAEHTSSGVAVTVCDVSDVKSQCSLKTESVDDVDFKATVDVIRDVTSEVVADAGATRCLVSNFEAAGEIVSVVKPKCLDDNASSSQAVVKEQTCQEEEIVDVGDAEYSAAIGQPTAKPSVLTDQRISDLVQGENFDDCDVEFDVHYENMSDENEDESEESERNDSSKCKGSAESEISDEVLKFYSLGGDNYETAEVHSTLDLMSLNMKTAPTGSSTVGSETGSGKQVEKRKRNGSSGRKRRRKRRPLNLVKKSVKKKLPIENKDSESASPEEEKKNDVVSKRVVKSGKAERPVKELSSPDSSETRPRKIFDRKRGQKSNVNAFLVSADAEKLCCALPEFGVGRTIATEAKTTNSDSTNLHIKSLCSESRGPDVLEKEAENLKPGKLDEMQKADVHETKSTNLHVKSLCSESRGPDLLEKEAQNLEPAKSDEVQKVDVHETKLEGETHKGAEEVCVKESPSVEELEGEEEPKGPEEVCVKDSPSVEDLKQIESVSDPSDNLEKPEAKKIKKRKRRCSGRSRCRKKKATLQKTCKATRKYRRTSKNVESTESSEQVDNFETDEMQELPLYDEDKKCAEIPDMVLNLFAKGVSPLVELPSTGIRTSPRRKAAVLCAPPDVVKPNSRLRRIRRKRRTSSKAADDDTPESTLLDMLNDAKFLESLKSAVKAVEGSGGSACTKVGSPDYELEASIEESNSVYFADTASTIQDCSENYKSSNVFAEHVHTTNSENVDYLNIWKSQSEEYSDVYSLGSPMRKCSIPYSATDEAQALQCSSLDNAISAVSYSALLNAVDSAGSTISYDAIRSALMTVATSSKGSTAPNPTQGSVELRDHTTEVSSPNSIAQLNISGKDICRESAESSFGNLLESTGTKESSTGVCYSSPKVVIPLSVYLRNVRQSNCKTVIKDTGCTTNNEPAFYTGVVKPSATDCPAYFANQVNQAANQPNHPNSQIINSRDPRISRMMPPQQQQSNVVQPLMQLEPHFPCNIPRTVLAHYTSNAQNVEETELQNDASFQSPVLTSPVQNSGCFPGYFHPFSNAENPIHASPVVKKPVCSITPFIHQSEKPISEDQQSNSKITIEPSKQDATELPKDKPPWDGNWQLIPISNLPPRPPIIFARLPLTERKIDGFPFDPRIRNEKESCVRKQLSRPDHVCDDVSLVIDGAEASASVKQRRPSSGALSNKNLVSKENTRVDAVENLAKDWFSQGKPPSGVGDITKRSLSENPGSRESNGKPAPADEILSDLLSSLHTESFEGEIIKNMEAGMLCGLNKERVLGNRSRFIPKVGPTSDKYQQQPKHRSGVDRRPSPFLGQRDRDRDNRKRDRDHRSGDKGDKIAANVHQRDSSRSHSRSTISSRGHDSRDNSRSRRDHHPSRRDYQRRHHRDSSRTHDDMSSQRSHVKPRLDVNSEGSAVSLSSTDPMNKITVKRPSEERLKKRQHSTDDKAEGYDARKRLRKSPSPRSRARRDGRQDNSKSSHHNREVNSKLVKEGEKQVGKLEPKLHDGKARESAEEALRRQKMLRVHSSRVGDDGRSGVRQYDSKAHHGSESREGRKSVESVKSDQKEAETSQHQSRDSSGSKERLVHGQDKGKQPQRGEHVEKRRLSNADAKERAKDTKDGDCSKASHSNANVRHELIQSPTTYSCLQQNSISQEDIHIDVNEKVNTEANDRTSHSRTHCADEQLDSNADLLSGVSGAGTLPTENVNAVVTEAEEEHQDVGSLVIHMEDASDEKDGESRLDCMMPPRSSSMTTDVHNGLKTSVTNEREKNGIFPISLRSETNETSPSNEKRLADGVPEKDEPQSYKSSCYDGDSCLVAPKTNTQIRADILKSIRSLKLLLEDKLKSDDVSDVSIESKTRENDESRTLSAAGSSENSFVLSTISSTDLIGNLGEEEEKASTLGRSDGSLPTRGNSSSDLSTRSDYCSRSSMSSFASVRGTVSSLSVSFEFVEASENAFAMADRPDSACAELKLHESEFFSNSYQARVNCSVPFLTPRASPGLPSESPEVEEKDAAELSCAAEKYITNTAEKSEMHAVEDCNEENGKNHGDRGNIMANVSGGVLNEMQKATVIERETTDLTEVFDNSYLIDIEPSGDSGEDKGMDKICETTEIYGMHRPLKAISTSPENCGQSELEMNNDTDECYIYQGTEEHCIHQDAGELFETEHEPHDHSLEPSNSNNEPCAVVNTRKNRAADFFQDINYNAGNAVDSIINVDSHDYHHFEFRSHNITKTEPDNLQTDEIPLLGDTFETGIHCKSEVESSSNVAGPSPSSKPRRGHRHGKIADVWSNISSGWKELSRDHDTPADDDRTGVCTELPSDVSAEALAAYKEVFRKEIAMTEQRIIDSCVFTDPCEGLTECQIKKLLRMNAANPEVEEELRLEYDILDLDKDVGKIQECMEKIRVQLGQFRSPALDKTYEHVEQKFNVLLAKKEMYQYRLTTLRRYHKSHFVHLVPDEFLFDEEIGKYISLEGMLLFLHKPTISVQNCVRLAALKRETEQTREAMARANVNEVEDVKRLIIKLRWLHLQRKVLLQQLCCTTEKGQHRLIQYLDENLAWYKSLQSEIDSTGDEQAEDDVQNFVLETVSVFESYIETLKKMQKSPADGRWTFNRKKTFKKRRFSRSSVESRNHEFDECVPTKKRRKTKDVNFDEVCDFEQGTSGRDGWRQEATSTSVYDQEDPGPSHRSSEFEVGRTRYERGLKRTDFEEDEGEEWRDSGYRYRGGEEENVVWHEEGKRRWDCVETEDSYGEQSGFTIHRHHSTRHSMRHVRPVKAHFSSGIRWRNPVKVRKSLYQERHRDDTWYRDRIRQEQSNRIQHDESIRRRRWYTRPYHEDSSYSRDWSNGQDCSDRSARGYPQHH